MSESLSEDELAELIRHGRISTSRSTAKRHQAKTSASINNKPKTQVSVTPAMDSAAKVESPKPSEKEPDSEWLRTEKEKVKRNIAAQRQDKQRRDEMQEAARF